MQRYPVLSLFSGLAQLCHGGIQHAGLSNRFRVQYFVECNTYRQRLLHQDYSETSLWGDVQTFRGQPGQFFVVTGGSPCQDNSGANFKGKGLAGSRSKLWWEQLRIIQECRPAIALWENPAGCRHPKGENKLSPLGTVLWSLESSGYRCQWQSIQACELGAPHERERCFVIAYAADLFERFGVVPSPWSGQVGEAIKVAANSHSERCEAWEDEQELQLQVRGQRIESNNPGGLCLTPSRQGMDARTETGLNSYHKGGWWSANPFDGTVAIPQRSLPNRSDRIAALGDSCTPQQAAVCWKYIDYLASCLELAANGS